MQTRAMPSVTVRETRFDMPESVAIARSPGRSRPGDRLTDAPDDGAEVNQGYGAGGSIRPEMVFGQR
jgi:hypothetical protein